MGSRISGAKGRSIFALTYLIAVTLPAFSVATKLETVVLHNVNLDSMPLNSSVWQNEGFEKANATQISKNLGKAEVNSASTSFLMARKSAKLYTILKKFDNNFLSIKFSSLIGKKVNIPLVKETTTTTTTTTTTASTTTTTTEIPIEKLPISVGVGSTLIQVESESGSMSISSGQIPPNASELTSHIIEIELNQANTKQTRRRRKRRELDSEEISQIHQIIKVANANKDKESNVAQPEMTNDSAVSPIIASEKLLPVPGMAVAQVQPLLPLTSVSEALVVKPAILTALEVKTEQHDHDDSKLTYKAWRNSKLNKHFRPPGFYLLIDDDVVFDNWEGLWENPNIFGKWYLNKTSTIWNQTEILVRWDEAPERNIKISFEWEPMDSASFFFLDDISIGTIGSKPQPLETISVATSVPIPEPELPIVAPMPPPPIANTNNNITLYIVVKGHTPEIPISIPHQAFIQNVSASPNTAAGPEPSVIVTAPTTTTSTSTTTTTESTTTTASTTTASTTSTQVPVVKPNNTEPKKKKPTKPRPGRPISGRTSTGADITAIIVLVVVVSLCLAILLTIICNRVQGSRRTRCKGRC